MIKEILKYTGLFIAILLFQALVLDNVRISSFVNPGFYILFILVLPFETPRWALLLAGFALGLSLDAFHNTPGLHAAATTLAAFIRPGVTRMISSRQEYEPGMRPVIADLGFSWVFRYALIIVFVHHFFLSFLEVFKFQNIILTLGRAASSAGISLLLIILTQYIFFRPYKKS